MGNSVGSGHNAADVPRGTAPLQGSRDGRRAKFPAIGRYDAFRLLRSRHIEEAKSSLRQAARSIDTPCLARSFAISPF